MKTNDAGVALIREFEGPRLKAYLDTSGIWTIGYGHTSAAAPPKVSAGTTITAAEAKAILRRDLVRFEGYVAAAVKVPMTPNQHAALVSWTFNLGPGHLSESTMLRRLNAGDYNGAADEMLRWNKDAGKIQPGLIRRRKAERALFLSADPQPGSQPSPAPAQSGDKPASAPPNPVPDTATAPVIAAVTICAARAGVLILAVIGG